MGDTTDEPKKKKKKKQKDLDLEGGDQSAALEQQAVKVDESGDVEKPKKKKKKDKHADSSQPLEVFILIYSSQPQMAVQLNDLDNLTHLNVTL